MTAANKIVQNMDEVLAAIRQAEQKRVCQAEEAELMAVTKYAADEDVLTLLSDGRVKHIGESRVQQATQRWKQPAFAKQAVTKHFIGHLQKNKVAQAAALFDFIDSIDELQTALLLQEQAKRLHKTLGVLIQIKLTDNPAQSGITLEKASDLLQELRPLDALRVCGYMAIAPRTDNPYELSSLFKQVKLAFDRDFPPAGPKRYLSLGMSGDFEVAVQEGSTLPRVGSRLFARHSEEL